MPGQQEPHPTSSPAVLRRTWGFTLQVLRAFHRNQGLLLAGAVAYYTLLSTVPMLALILVGLSHFIPEEQLIQTVVRHLELLVPGYAESLADQVRGFLDRRHLVGVVGFLVMMFFSSMAFSVLESTMAVIFSHRQGRLRRPFFISAVIPYLYILVLAVGFLLVTLIAGALDALERRELLLFGVDISLRGYTRPLFYLLGLLGMVLMLTSLYLVMPVGRISVRHALSGALTAALLWEALSPPRWWPC
jgi:membrane protein